MPPFVIEESLAISGGDMQHRVTIPAKHIEKVDDTTFIHVSTVPNYAAVLFAGRRDTKTRVLSKTSVFEQLVSLRNDKVQELIQTKSVATENLAIFDGTAPKRTRLAADTKMGCPDTVTIRTPAIAGAIGIRMKVISSWKKTSPLFIEVDLEHITY